MSRAIEICLLLAWACLLVTVALGYLLPELPLRNRVNATLCLLGAIGTLMHAWEIGGAR